ncbi:MAG: hypothetical protein CL974_01560 [Euryarchaeota archaeon]|nr:hypothetical protein [Euryarchaeota archaeon]
MAIINNELLQFTILQFYNFKFFRERPNFQDQKKFETLLTLYCATWFKIQYKFNINYSGQ